MSFDDRRDAGRQLGRRLRDEDLQAPVVLALPRGGVPVAHEVADALGAPMDVFVARKVGAPGRPEYGLGAIAEGDGEVFDDDRVEALGLDRAHLEDTVMAERRELQRRVRDYRGDRPLPDLTGRTAVVVDDGLATGVTAEAALKGVRSLRPDRTVLAVPVGAPATVERLRALADVVCLEQPRSFRAVGLWYRDFGQTTDDEVAAILDRHDAPGSAEQERAEQERADEGSA